MQTGGLNTMYRALLARNPAPLYRIEVWRENVRVDTYGDEGLPILQGSITATLSSRVTRQLAVTFPLLFTPADNNGWLTPYGNQIIVRAGVYGYGGPNHFWTVFRGRITDVDVDADQVRVRADDLAAELTNSFIEVPRNSNTGQLVITEWQDLVREAYPDADFGTSDDLPERVPKMTWSDSRAAAADSIAQAAGAFWYTLGDGSFVLRRIPWTIEQTPLLTWETGVDGTLLDGSYLLSRENVFNKITVVGEAADGSPPVSATVFDNDITSPTYLYGPFGEKGRRIVSNATTNSGAAFQLAERYLRRSKALTRTWRASIVSDPSLELGDCVTISHLNQMDIQVVESFDIPLSGDNVMNVSLRALAPGTALEEE
jgi:hypothetical protein